MHRIAIARRRWIESDFEEEVRSFPNGADYWLSQLVGLSLGMQG